MAVGHEWKKTPSDVQILRALAARVMEIAKDPVQDERRQAWKALNSLKMTRPMILAEAGGIHDELGIEKSIRCREEWARGVEDSLVRIIWQHEHVKDDVVVEPWFDVNWAVTVSDYGVSSPKTYGNNEGKMASYHWEAPIKDLDADFGKLKARTFAVDREKTLLWKAHLESVFGGLLPVRIRGDFWWTVGLTWQAILLIGLENLMLFMYDNPEGLHRLMAFLRDDNVAFAEWLEKENLYTLNNENDYVGSGSRGHTDELPQKDWKPGNPVRMKDLWVLSESQETVGVGPELFEEFVFPYQLEIAKRFGLLYYGCCEPVHSRWHVIERFPNLRKVSVSPWCKEEFMAEALGRKYGYSRKPNPALISTEKWDEEAIRSDLRTTIRAAKNCNFEFSMKDVHTINNEPWRLGRWVEIAREECSHI